MEKASTHDKVDFPTDFDEKKFVCKLCHRNVNVTQNTTRAVSIPDSDRTQHPGSTKIHLLKCPHCKKDAGVWRRNSWMSIAEYLTKPGGISGIKQVTSESDTKVLFVLSQVCHNQYDLDDENNSLESPFLAHGHDEFAKIMWVDGEAAGFYTLKTKGSLVLKNSFAMYCMPVIDTLYVCREFRRKGLATQLIQDVVKQFPSQNIGFSSPVSISLLKVLLALMLREEALRDRLWQCEYDGSEGYRCNIWLHTRSVFSKRKRENEENQGVRNRKKTAV